MTPKPYTKTPFMEELDKKMTEYGLTTSSKMTYLRVIEYLSGKPVEDLSFFMDAEAIEKKLECLSSDSFCGASGSTTPRFPFLPTFLLAR